MTYAIAALAVETGIGPNELVDAPPGVLEAMFDFVRRRAEAQRKANAKRR